MAMPQASVIEAVETLAPPFLQASWDCSGLQCASSRREVSKMAVCLDAVPELVEKALDEGCDFILSHHPLALKAEPPNKLNDYWRVLRLLLGSDTALYAAHTSLDANISGPAGFLGRELKLKDAAVLDPLPGHEGCGFGGIGNLPEEMSFAKFSSLVMRLLGLDIMPVCGRKRKDIIRRAAYCGGSGSSLAALAFQKGADVFISGDIKYHAALESEICILDAGHYPFEAEMMRRSAQYLMDSLKDIEVIYLESPNPFTFILNV